MQETETYRVRPGLAPGTKLYTGDVMQTPEAYLVEEVQRTIRNLDAAYPRSHDAQRLRGRLDGLLEALAVMQAGSDHFGGDEARRLEIAHRELLRTEAS